MKDVWFKYEKDGKDIVKDLSFEVKKEMCIRDSEYTVYAPYEKGSISINELLNRKWI